MEQSSKSVGQAGPRDDTARSDVHVRIEPGGEGLRIEVRSKVQVLFGDAIRESALEMARRFAVTDARIEIDDRGALPFVLDARLEAALRRTGAGASGPEVLASAPPATERARLRRSRLYLPGNEPKFMINAGLHRPDGVILDLEDSVHPDEKDAARILVRNALRSVDFRGAERMVRINQGMLGLSDLETIVPEGPHCILIPKTEAPEQVRQVAAAIERHGDTGRPVWLMPILETALGIENAYSIATAAESVVALTIGLEDYTADLGVAKTSEGEESKYARMRLVNAARAAGIQAIDSVFGDVGDAAGLSAWARRARAMGFEGMGCVHPRQIRPIHEAFAPTPAELEKALRIVEAFERAEAEGRSVVSLGSRMIDPPVVLRARRLVDLARRSGLEPRSEYR